MAPAELAAWRTGGRARPARQRGAASNRSSCVGGEGPVLGRARRPRPGGSKALQLERGLVPHGADQRRRPRPERRPPGACRCPPSRAPEATRRRLGGDGQPAATGPRCSTVGVSPPATTASAMASAAARTSSRIGRVDPGLAQLDPLVDQGHRQPGGAALERRPGHGRRRRGRRRRPSPPRTGAAGAPDRRSSSALWRIGAEVDLGPGRPGPALSHWHRSDSQSRATRVGRSPATRPSDPAQAGGSPWTWAPGRRPQAGATPRARRPRSPREHVAGAGGGQTRAAGRGQQHPAARARPPRSSEPFTSTTAPVWRPAAGRRDPVGSRVAAEPAAAYSPS